MATTTKSPPTSEAIDAAIRAVLGGQGPTNTSPLITHALSRLEKDGWDGGEFYQRDKYERPSQRIHARLRALERAGAVLNLGKAQGYNGRTQALWTTPERKRADDTEAAEAQRRWDEVKQRVVVHSPTYTVLCLRPDDLAIKVSVDGIVAAAFNIADGALDPVEAEKLADGLARKLRNRLYERLSA